MSRRRSSTSSPDTGCMVALLPFLLVLGLFLEIFENIGFLFIAVAVFCVFIGIVAVVENSTKKKEQAEAEYQKYLAIVNAPETRPSLTNIPSSTPFANKEEEHVNTSFREYLKKNNDVVLAQSHVDYLSKKANDLRALGRGDEAAQFDSDISQAREVLSTAQSKLSGTFESEFNDILYKSTKVSKAYTAFASMLPNERLPLIGDFFNSPQIKIVSLGGSSALLFTPSYVMNYSGPEKAIRFIQYKEVSVSSLITTEIRDGLGQPDDEIEHIGYRYETKDGFRDMRYSWANNPCYTFVYRGVATIRCSELSYEQKFSNKSLTKEFEKALNKYLSLVTGKYMNVLSQILSHDEELSKTENIDAFMAQQAAEKQKVK